MRKKKWKKAVVCVKVGGARTKAEDENKLTKIS